MNRVLIITRDVLIGFMISLSDAEQVILSEEANAPILKNREVLKSHIAAKATKHTAEHDGE